MKSVTTSLTYLINTNIIIDSGGRKETDVTAQRLVFLPLIQKVFEHRPKILSRYTDFTRAALAKKYPKTDKVHHAVFNIKKSHMLPTFPIYLFSLDVRKTAVPSRAVAQFFLNVHMFFYKYFRVSVSSQLYTEIQFRSEKKLTPCG